MRQNSLLKDILLARQAWTYSMQQLTSCNIQSLRSQVQFVFNVAILNYFKKERKWKCDTSNVISFRESVRFFRVYMYIIRFTSNIYLVKHSLSHRILIRTYFCVVNISRSAEIILKFAFGNRFEQQTYSEWSMQ